MDFEKLAQERYSVRKFSPKEVEREKLDQILNAGRLAPTACNYQPQRVLVASSGEALEKVLKSTHHHFGAPVILVICYDKNVSAKRTYDGADLGEADADIVTTHMMLQAADLGLGTTWIGGFDPKIVKEEFALPESYVPVALLPVGYPAEDAMPSPRHTEREPLQKTVFWNSFSE
jgi:nitroreductase